MRYKGLLNDLKIDWELQTSGKGFLDEWYLLHYLSQFIYMCNASYAEKAEDRSHLLFDWLYPGCRIAGKPIKGNKGEFRLILDPGIPALAFTDDKRNIISHLRISEQTYPDIRYWIQKQLSLQGLDTDIFSDTIPHSIRIPGAASIDNTEIVNYSNLTDIRRMYCNLYRILTRISEHLKHPSVTFCRPDSFELLTTMILRRNKRGKIIRSMDAGLSPPRSGETEAFYFVRMYSSDDFQPEGLSDLPFGYWRLQEKKEAVLPLSAVNNQPRADDQYQVLRDFLGFSMDACWAELMKGF